MCTHTLFFERVLTFRKQLLDWLTRRMHPLLRRRLDAEDLLSDVANRCPQNVEELLQLSPQRFYCWLRKATYRRLTTQHRRHLDSHKRSVWRELQATTSNLEDQQFDCAGNPAEPPERQVLSTERRDLLEAAMHRLPPLDCKILRLRYLESLSLEEVAPMLGLSTETCRKRIQRATGKLARLLPPSLGI
jgi:RNA polymerase sigma factor (sigma-70 family)